MNRIALLASSLLATVAFHPAIAAPVEDYTVIVGGRNVGHLKTEQAGASTRIVYDFKNNGRGPTMAETVAVDASGLPTSWTVTGTTTFGSKVDERFSVKGKQASWTDSTGKASARLNEPKLYISQSASPWALGLYARALLKDADGEMAVLPGGTIKLDKGEKITVPGGSGPVEATTYTLSGIDTNPSYVLLDGSGDMFAFVTPEFAVVRKGYEGEEERLRAIAERLSTSRYANIQKATAHKYEQPVRIRNVRLFDSKSASLTEPKSVLVYGNKIAAVETADSPSTPGEVLIDGAGGTLVPGLYEMHGHLSQDDALLNLAAGVTTIRDMGNDNELLDTLIDRIESGAIAGPRIIRYGFIEGKSPFNSNNGTLVESEAQAVDAVRWYAARGFEAIKIYNSINPQWVPAMIREADRLGLRVSGHVPAFTNADAMIAAGYDELTHINQLMLGWVLQPGEDTRTLLRLTALKRLPALDFNSERVQKTIAAIAERKVAVEPTIGIHEALTQNRDGQVPPGAVDYLDHMPIGVQRASKRAWVDTSGPGDDQAYRGAYDKIIAALRALHQRGVLIVPGTDTGGAFTFHRELELFQKIGLTPGEVLKRATYDMAAYMEQDQQLGSIEKGKLADFFLVPGDPTKDLKAIKSISMVVKDGTVYFPSEIYSHFGIRPFAEPPKVTAPANSAD